MEGSDFMITVISKMTLKPGTIRVFMEGYAELVAEYRKETGCRSYNVLQEIKNEMICYMVGQWDSEAAYQQHLDSPNFQRAYAYSIGFLSKEPETSICTTTI